RSVVPRGGFDAGRETDVAPEVVLVGDVAQIAENLGLRRVPLRPLPLGLELGIEAVRVVDALDVATGARIAVPVPGAADVVAALDHRGSEPEAAQPVEHVEPCEAGAYHHDVEVPIAEAVRPNLPCGHPTSFHLECRPKSIGRSFGPPEARACFPAMVSAGAPARAARRPGAKDPARTRRRCRCECVARATRPAPAAPGRDASASSGCSA